MDRHKALETIDAVLQAREALEQALNKADPKMVNRELSNTRRELVETSQHDRKGKG